MSKYDLEKISTKPPEELDKDETEEKTKELIREIDDLQNILFASKRQSLLIVLQGLDASGKDGAVKKVFSGVNPEGVVVKSFKVPTGEELSHDFLWRIHKYTPARGMIQIFNRSHYEDVLETRVLNLTDDETAKKRFAHINNFENLLRDEGTDILKFYLHISREEQIERLEERQTNPKKFWKYNPEDFDKAKNWKEYYRYYMEIFENCSPEIPWTIVPSDNNWYKEYIVAKETARALRKMDLRYPALK